MNLQETIIQLNELKLRGMLSSFEAMTSLPVQNRPSLEVAISKMVDAEVQDRRDRKTAMYLKISKLRYTALLEDVICGADRNFTKDDLAAIADCAFIRRHEKKYDLLIWDDFGLQPMDDKTRLAMLQILEERYERKTVIIASQLPIAKWYDYIGDPTLADAIMDRLVANASKIELKGDSMRQKLKK